MMSDLYDDIEAAKAEEKQRQREELGIEAGGQSMKCKRFYSYSLKDATAKACKFAESIPRTDLISITETIDTSPAKAENIVTVWYWLTMK